MNKLKIAAMAAALALSLGAVAPAEAAHHRMNHGMMMRHHGMMMRHHGMMMHHRMHHRTMHGMRRMMRHGM